MRQADALSAVTALGSSWVLWLLLASSVLGVAIALERAVQFWVTRDDLSRHADEIDRWVRGGRWQSLEHRLSESPSYEARVLGAALGCDDPGRADQRMLGELERVRLDMERHLAVLGTLASNAPFVGLLGTVIGIVSAFRELDQSGGRLTEGLMAEVGEALLATAVGLLVALPAVAAFNLFRRIVQSRLGRADALRRLLLSGLMARAGEAQ